MRWSLILCFLAAPAFAWETRVEGRLCVLEHAAANLELVMTFDASGPLYTITLTRPEPWDDGPVFALRFDGARALAISTTRHLRADGGRQLSVSDTGFGNVLDGLQFNDMATARIGGDEISLSLVGAAPEIESFRRCTDSPLT